MTANVIRSTDYGPCSECGDESITLLLDDPELGEKGSFTLSCMNGHEFWIPAETTARTRIQAIRQIVTTHGAMRVEGYLVDAFTAQMLLKVYEALSPENKRKFGKPTLPRLVELGWSVVT